MWIFIVINISVFVGVLLAGIYKCDTFAYLLMCEQVVNSFLFWEWFPIGAMSLAVMLIVHHIIIHYDHDFSNEITLFTLQLKDISNHETWIVACITATSIYLLCASQSLCP